MLTEACETEEYKRFLEQNAVSSGLRLNDAGFIFQQDNDPKHYP